MARKDPASRSSARTNGRTSPAAAMPAAVEPAPKAHPLQVAAPAPSAQQPIEPARIAQRAYELYRQRGGTDGQDVQDWLQAERELREGRR